MKTRFIKIATQSVATAFIVALLGQASAAAQSGNVQPRQDRQAHRLQPANFDPAFQQRYPGQSAPLRFAQNQISASDAKAIALRAVPGSEFLDIRQINAHTYRVRVIKDGRRVDVIVDARTGKASI